MQKVKLMLINLETLEATFWTVVPSLRRANPQKGTSVLPASKTSPVSRIRKSSDEVLIRETAN